MTNFKIIDDAVTDDTAIVEHYEITSFGADFDVEGIYRRLTKGDIFIPEFQRNYVWNYKEACEFIESILLGLPVPGIFLSREPKTNKLLVIDGQQRLKTIEFFMNGTFIPSQPSKNPRKFKLINIQKQFIGLTYKDLIDSDRIKFDDYIIHATIIKQDKPKDDDSSIYQIFKRLNTGGRKLAPQEIRSAIYHGKFIDFLNSINQNENWRQIFGPINNRLKDKEFILRFLAMYHSGNEYKKPMTEFLNIFTKKNRFATDKILEQYEQLFLSTINVIFGTFGRKVFKLEKSIIAAIYDSVMVGVANRIKSNTTQIDNEKLKRAYNSLIKNVDYLDSVSHHTSDESRVRTRLKMAIEIFMSV